MFQKKIISLHFYKNFSLRLATRQIKQIDTINFFFNSESGSSNFCRNKLLLQDWNETVIVLLSPFFLIYILNNFFLKNRPQPGEKPLAAFQNKSALLLSASPGKFGAIRGLIQLRAVLAHVGTLVLPDTLSVPLAHQVLQQQQQIQQQQQQQEQQLQGDGEWRLKDEAMQKSLEAVCRKLVEFVSRNKIDK